MTARATLIGDVVGSRRAHDRPALHRMLTDLLADVNARHPAVEPLRVTVGDEYQAVYDDVGAAARASLALVAGTRGRFEVRHGIGWGAVATLQAEPPVQDGPGWWAARSAIDSVHAAEQRPSTRWRRTAFRVDPAEERADAAPGVAAYSRAVESAMVVRDRLVSGLDERALSVLDGMLRGETQREVAERLGVSASAVSQRIRAAGLDALVLADRAWLDVGEGNT